MIPDTYCSPHGPQYGYQCPPGMKCVSMGHLKKQERGFNGFDEIRMELYLLNLFPISFFQNAHTLFQTKNLTTGTISFSPLQ
jgi:hypothetical protein